VIEFFAFRADAEAMLALVVGDEPDWRDTLHVEPIDIATGAQLEPPCGGWLGDRATAAASPPV
jgi:hypothetical protein